jgi:hypothetical protein
MNGSLFGVRLLVRNPDRPNWLQRGQGLVYAGALLGSSGYSPILMRDQLRELRRSAAGGVGLIGKELAITWAGG